MASHAASLPPRFTCHLLLASLQDEAACFLRRANTYRKLLFTRSRDTERRGHQHECTGKDAWNGTINTRTQIGNSIQSQIPRAHYK